MGNTTVASTLLRIDEKTRRFGDRQWPVGPFRPKGNLIDAHNNINLHIFLYQAQIFIEIYPLIENCGTHSAFQYNSVVFTAYSRLVD